MRLAIVGLILLTLVVEALGFWLTARVLGWLAYGNWHDTEWVGAFVLAIIVCLIGVRIVKIKLAKMTTALLQGEPGRAMVGIAGAILIAKPGFITAILGVLLQIPWCQRRFASLGARILASLTKRAMQQMGGRFPGAGAFPGFPGMQQRPSRFGGQADERVRPPPRIIEVNAERIDGKGKS